MHSVTIDPRTGDVALAQIPAPSLRTRTDVRLRMLEVGICGTDKEIAACQYGTPPAGDHRLVMGHESLGEVVEVGPDVRDLAPGDLVVPMVRRPCPHARCVPCRSGRQDFCTTGDFTERGIKEAHGFLSEFVVDDAAYMLPVPAELRDVAVLVEPLTIAQKALAQLELVQQRLPWACPLGADGRRVACHKAVVLGAGPVGLLGAMTLLRAGFDVTVYSNTPAPNERSALVEALGARYVSSQEHDVEELAVLVGGIDVVYEAVGASKLAFDVLRVLGTNGIFLFTGVPGRGGPLPVDTDALMRNLVLKNQVVLGSVNAGRQDFEAAVADLEQFRRRWPGALAQLIGARHPVGSVTTLLKGRTGGIKNVVSLAGLGKQSSLPSAATGDMPMATAREGSLPPEETTCSHGSCVDRQGLQEQAPAFTPAG